MDTDKNKGEDQDQEQDGLDATYSTEDNKKQQQKKDIENMDEQGEEVNPHHNELEEPLQPKDLNLEEEMKIDNNEKEKENN
jgi:midasin